MGRHDYGGASQQCRTSGQSPECRLARVHTLGAAEAHNLGKASALDPMLVQQVIAEGVGSSRMWRFVVR